MHARQLTRHTDRSFLLSALFPFVSSAQKRKDEYRIFQSTTHNLSRCVCFGQKMSECVKQKVGINKCLSIALRFIDRRYSSKKKINT